MDVIKNYLDSMFANLPVTDEILKAKYSLLEMMEDKYEELISEGKNTNEAVGIVISEFGNLNELAEELGINNFVNEEEKPGRFFSIDDARNYIIDKFKGAYLLAIGVCLCIICPIPCILADVIADSTLYEALAEALGALILIAILAIGIVLIVLSSGLESKWKFMKKEKCSVDFMTVDYVTSQKNSNKTNVVLFYALGIALCVFAAAPAMIIDALPWVSSKYEDLSGAILLLLVGCGVAMIIAAANKQAAFENILKLNEEGILPEKHDDENVAYTNETVAKIMSVYWPTVTAVYLIWSFLSFNWHITWIIWPVAAIGRKIINTLYS